MRDKRYEFPITLSGYGKTPKEAWEDALEGFMQNPGVYEEYTEEEVEEGE